MFFVMIHTENFPSKGSKHQIVYFDELIYILEIFFYDTIWKVFKLIFFARSGYSPTDPALYLGVLITIISVSDRIIYA